MKHNFLTVDLPLDDKGYRWSFSIFEFWIEDMKYPTALLHMEWKNKKFYWEFLYSNLWLDKFKELWFKYFIIRWF